MSASYLAFVVIGAAIGTAILRYLPARLAQRAAHPRIEALLRGVPAAALGALLVTSVGSALPAHHVFTTLVALAVAAVLAWRPGGVLWPVLSAVAVAFAGLALHLR